MPQLYRHRLPLAAAGVAAILLTTVGNLTLDPGPVRVVTACGTLAGFVLLAASLALGVGGARWAPDHPPRLVEAPVRGRWLAVNSPATKVPSHGVRDYGQSHAIDLVAEPDRADQGVRPTPGAGPGMRPAQDYPAFGAPVLAMLGGTVVAVEDRQRDHRSRTSTPALVVMQLEAVVRSLAGPRRVVGNHVTVRGPDGVFALVAHLRRGSASVSVGDVVTAGQQIGECGNSGNSSEPHVHAQVMDRASLWTAQGVPLRFAGIRVGDEVVDGVPPTGEHLVSSAR